MSTIIDSTLHSLAEIVDKVGDLKPGDGFTVRSLEEADWLDLPAMIKSEYPWSTIRATPTMDDFNRVVKVKIVR